MLSTVLLALNFSASLVISNKGFCLYPELKIPLHHPNYKHSNTQIQSHHQSMILMSFLLSLPFFFRLYF